MRNKYRLTDKGVTRKNSFRIIDITTGQNSPYVIVRHSPNSYELLQGSEKIKIFSSKSQAFDYFKKLMKEASRD